MKCISYKKGYKYQLVEDYIIETDIKPKQLITTEYLNLTLQGKLTIKKGYAWDGPSGPAFDTKNFMRGSLVHDALYQLMREKPLVAGKFKKPADRLLEKVCIEDGMSKIRAQWVYYGVKIGGRPATDPANKKRVIKAPKSCS